MAVPTLTPSSQTSRVVLPATGTLGDVTSANLPFGIYATNGSLQDMNFVSGAVDQVAFTYRKLGGDVLDIELSTQNIYAAYEEAVFEYSYIVNTHQAKNALPNLLGDSTGSFDHHGQLKSGDALSSSLGETDVALRFPRFNFQYAKRVGNTVAHEVGVGGNANIYSASFNTTSSVQDYDLQTIISSSAAGDTSVSYAGQVGGKRVTIRRVYFKTPQAMWRFYGYYGGLNVVGNLHQYGQFADDSSFELVPTWQNKAQAMAFEDAIYTRISHFSYEIKNNNLRLFPNVTAVHPKKMWVEFSVDEDSWEENADRPDGAGGINNMNTLPFENIPFKNINSMGKQWMRRFALALTKEMLGQVRGKFGSIPIPGESVTLNADSLLSQGQAEQTALRDELKTVLDELTYARIAETEAGIMDSANRVQSTVPAGIFVG
tara:strand:- start:78 stop:1370 length:1293 start_codon:yes stop_codon:yes gene_type:complete